MLIHILIALLAIIVILFVVISLQSADFRITRKIVINAPSPTVFELINDLHKWDSWSPWAKLDPNAKNIFEGPATGVGSSMSWVGNNKVGSGSATITESRPNDLVKIRLDFLKPMKATNTAEFIFTSRDNQTELEWSMYGKNNFIGKAVNVIFNCEKMVGGQFEQGLAQIKVISEGK